MFSYKPTSLPPPHSPLIQQQLADAAVERAYTLCYAEQQRLLEHYALQEESLVHVRILGWIFIFATSTEIKMALTEGVMSYAGQLDELGKFFLDHWIRLREYFRPSMWC